MNSIFIGHRGETAACKYLKQNGYKILKRNYRKKYGEIDIVAQKSDLISFVEVKTRSNKDFGLACEAVTKAKKDRIIKTAQTYINEYKIDCNFSFDVIEIYHNFGKIEKIEHIECAFS